MITVFLRGGLGNQMFQYALGLHLAKRNRTELRLDASFLNDRFPRRQFTYRAYDLDVFDINPAFTRLSKISGRIPVPGLWLGADLALARIENALGVRKIIKEKKDGAFDPSVFLTPPSAFLYGFWQSEKYFIDIAEDVRRAFRFRYSIEGEAVRIAEQIAATDSVSVNVRRGDYLLSANLKRLGETTLSYYGRAAAHIADRVRSPHFFVISDDIAWCREHLRLGFPTTYVSATSGGYKQNFHLQLIAQCKHNIIANSTFGWWGAWLNQNPGKIVVAPKIWHPGLERDDIVPERWIRL
ncbi:MAG: alpha-1,2-fucosyltransferase [Patescibacteria group bacterium]|nr:alpha-1,2-fucosyltransferase [Patescibacteria group bacterium]